MRNVELKGLLTLLGGIAVWFMLVTILISLTGCGVAVKAKGGTQNYAHVDGKVTTEIVLKIDLSDCKAFDGAAQLDCIESITGALASLGDLSKVLVCPPDDTAKCDLLSKIVGAIK